MSEKIKLNKNSLREQNQSLKLYLEFLPTLELRKQQLQTEIRQVKVEIAESEKELSVALNSAKPWIGRLGAILPVAKDLLKIEKITVETINVAGVKVPEFKGIDFSRVPYSLVATPWLLDSALLFFEGAISIREKTKTIREKHRLIQKELTKTTQRINLYEKVLVPEAKENIRKIKVYLGDQQTAAVCRAKIAKNKIILKAMAKTN